MIRPSSATRSFLSPSIPVKADGSPARVSFRNNFNLQDGFDGGVLEISFDDGLTFQDILAAIENGGNIKTFTNRVVDFDQLSKLNN